MKYSKKYFVISNKNCNFASRNKFYATKIIKIFDVAIKTIKI
nr:MAG TPA: hypothetical protein [Caudoviricetes sp.]